MNRRQFLQGLAAAPVLSCTTRLYAAAATSPRLLVVFLRGGYDCLHALVPHASAFYYEARPHIAIARPDDTATGGALRLDDTWALAPALRDSLGGMFQRQELAFVPFAGCDDTSRSHFETQDRMEAGLAASSAPASGSGFLARLAQATHASPIAFTDNLPLVLRGAGDVPNVSLRGSAGGTLDARHSAAIASMYRDHALAASVDEGFAVRREVAEQETEPMRAASRGAASARGLDTAITRVARMMRERYRIGFVDVGGWDTHVNQGGAQGALADNLAGLGRALGAYSGEIGATAWRDTTIVVLSEFGRTFRENGNRGTDHGHGTCFWVLGGAVRGGRLCGEQVALDREHLFQDRDLPVLNDYRGVLGGLFRRLYELSPATLEQVFPGARPLDLGLV